MSLAGSSLRKLPARNSQQLALCRRSALDRYGEWKIVTSGASDDLRALAPACGADGKDPFLALAKVASTNASSRFKLAPLVQMPG